MRLSVICPVYNTPPELLDAAIASVLRQDVPEVVELVLADDASTDAATRAKLAELAAGEARLRLLRLEANGGPSRARHAAIAAAEGDWIAFIDADDLWAPGGLAALAEAHRRWPAFNWVAANTAVMDRDGGVTAATRLSAAMAGTAMADGIVELAGPQLTRTLIGGDWLHLGACLIRRESLLAAGGFADGHLYSEDWLLLLRLSVAERLLYVERETYLYRRQQPSLTTASPRRLTSAVLSSSRAAFHDPRLRQFRRELRWTLYRRGKALAAENLLAGRRLAALRFALEAWSRDPREVGDLARLVPLLVLRDRGSLARRLGRYTTAQLSRSDASAPAGRQ